LLLLCQCIQDTISYSHSFPTRRSSDLRALRRRRGRGGRIDGARRGEPLQPVLVPDRRRDAPGAASEGRRDGGAPSRAGEHRGERSEEHTSELQSREKLVCRLLLEKKKQ